MSRKSGGPFTGEFRVAKRGANFANGRRFNPISGGLSLQDLMLIRTDADIEAYDYSLSIAMSCKKTGTILTCGKDSTPVDWNRPQEVKGRRAQKMSAAGISRLPRESYPICLFHGLNPCRPTPYMNLHLNKSVDGLKHDVFQCPVESCAISFILAKTRTAVTKILLTEADVDAHASRLAGDEDASDDEVQILSSVSGTASSSKSQQVGAKKGVVITLSSSVAKSSRFQPSTTPRMPTLDGGFVPVFTESVAIARATFDDNTAMVILHCGMTGLYRRAPESHPAFEVEHCAALDVYDISTHANAMERGGGALWEYAYRSSAGSVIRALSSATGIPLASVQILADEKTACAVCKCVFTRQGYNRHIVGGKCGNWHVAMPVERVAIPANHPTPLVERTYRQGTTVEDNPSLQTALEFQESRLGAALLAFNSRFGVPADVWAVVSTAYIVCDECYLARTFTAHRAHCNDEGECQDPGQEAPTA